MIHVRSYVRSRPVDRSELAIMDLFDMPSIRPELFRVHAGHNGGPVLDDQPDWKNCIPDNAPKGWRGHYCTECQVPISPYSRGKCRTCGYIGLKKYAPEDFLAVLRKFGSAGAAKHYHAGLSTITRWRQEVGIAPHMRTRKAVRGRVRARGFAQAPLMQKRDFTLAGQAAEFLRTVGPVYRCDDRGKPSPNGSHWNRNGRVLADDEIISRAQRMGWSAVEM